MRLSMYRRKLQSKLKEAEDSLTDVGTKYSALEKTKQRLSNELEDLNLTLESVRLLKYLCR